MPATLMAVYTLDRALEKSSRKWLVWHFLALFVAILSEFGVAWFALAAGLYSHAAFARQPAARGLLPVWLGGQCLAAVLYLVLDILVVKPVAESTNVSFPRAGQNPRDSPLSASSSKWSM